MPWIVYVVLDSMAMALCVLLARPIQRTALRQTRMIVSAIQDTVVMVLRAQAFLNVVVV